eukprot:scaffold186624_cov23-Tisochrysis_lutea.AAC.1
MPLLYALPRFCNALLQSACERRNALSVIFACHYVQGLGLRRPSLLGTASSTSAPSSLLHLQTIWMLCSLQHVVAVSPSKCSCVVATH